MSRTVALRRLRRDSEPLIGAVLVHQHAEALVGLEHEMGGGGEDAFEGRKPLADERRHFAQGAALHEQQQVVGAAHQVGRAHFGEAADALGDGVEAALALRGHLDLDDGGDLVQVELVLVQDGLVAADDAVLFVIGDALVDLGAGRGPACARCSRAIRARWSAKFLTVHP